MMALKLEGQRFGRLTVVERAEVNKKRSHWLCICDCGNQTIVLGSLLMNGNTKSCGCGKYIHPGQGLRGTPLYSTWYGMKQRCYYKKAIKYKNYGGRGIQVCDEWRNDPKAFCDWAIANGWEKGLSLDRIDNDGNYEPANCRWISQKEQCNNRGNNVLLTHDGQIHTIPEWSKLTGLSETTIRGRVASGWGHDKVLTVQTKERMCKNNVS